MQLPAGRSFRITVRPFTHFRINPEEDRSKFERRIQRFRLLCSHARNARGARTLLFIRFLADSGEFSRIDETYTTLRLWAGAQIRLVFISMLQAPTGKRVLYRHGRFPRVLVYLVGEVDLLDYTPISEACRFAVMDEAELLSDVPTTSPQKLQREAAEFADPYTPGWILPLHGRDPAFFPDGADIASDCCKALHTAAQAGDVRAIRAALELGADANVWDTDGMTPLHHLIATESRRATGSELLDVVATLLLAHGDPRCRDRSGRTVLDFWRDSGSLDCGMMAQVLALLTAVAAGDDVEAASLASALEALNASDRLQLAHIIGCG